MCERRIGVRLRKQTWRNLVNAVLAAGSVRHRQAVSESAQIAHIQQQAVAELPLNIEAGLVKVSIHMIVVEVLHHGICLLSWSNGAETSSAIRCGRRNPKHRDGVKLKCGSKDPRTRAVGTLYRSRGAVA